MSRFACSAMVGALALVGTAAAAQPAEPSDRSGTSLRNLRGQVVGNAVAAPERRALKVSITVRGFTPGTYGVHLHQIGRCDAPDFSTAGAHWNPAGRQHGRLNPQGPHLGDLPNLTVRPNGTGRVDFDLPLAAVAAGGANPLLDADGTAIVVHAAADDERTDPSGNSGARIACGVLTPLR